jgi:hypothetical protein
MQKAFINREKADIRNMLPMAVEVLRLLCREVRWHVVTNRSCKMSALKYMLESVWQCRLCHEICIHNTALYCVFLSYIFLYLSINITVFPQLSKLLTSRNFCRSSFFAISSWNFYVVYATSNQNEPPVPYRFQTPGNKKCLTSCYAQSYSKNSICTELMHWLLFVNLCSQETPEIF